MQKPTHHRHLSTSSESGLVGRTAENLTSWFLNNHHYHLIDRNYNTASGEIDIIAAQTIGLFTHIHFVEVKSRTVNIPWSLYRYTCMNPWHLSPPLSLPCSHHTTKCCRPVAPESAVSRKKQAKIYQAARSWIAAHKQSRAVFHFDVAAVTFFLGSPPRIKFYPDAYYPRQQFGW